MKRLSFTQEDMDLMFQEFKQNLLNFKSNQDKFVYEKKFSEMAKIDENTVKKPIIYFTMQAWLEMQALVKNCDKEIAWQATVEKKKFKGKEDKEDFYYFIKQVFVYPQKVTGTFVDVDTVKYAEWSLKLEDEIYNTLRFQGHSHVNMATSPSGTDLNTYQNFLEQLSKDDFYIFMILNKRSEFTIMVYDYAQDILFETKDCYVDVLTPQGSLNKWTENNMKLVEHKEEPKRYPIDYETYKYDYGYSCPSYNKPQNNTKPAVQDQITYANIKGFLKNGKWVKFLGIDDAIEWFVDHPEFIDEANLSKEHLKLIMEYSACLDPKPEQPKKRGRPPKGNKK